MTALMEVKGPGPGWNEIMSQLPFNMVQWYWVSFIKLPCLSSRLNKRLQKTQLQTGDTKATGKPVQIVSPDPNKTEGYCVDRDELERIFANPKVAKTPVSIYSISGACRKGKSFMLSFWLRHLKSENSDSWLDPQNDKLVDGFAWRGGAERHTQGIWIWDEPFLVETPQGKIALFLVDTQGAYDPETGMKDCLAIFALSTFMSSVQVYNVKEQIQEDTLQNFQLFTEYAKAAKQNGKDLQEPFQNLVFLIRDWQHTSHAFGWEGGKEVLDKLLQPQALHHDTESVRESLRNSFETIKCCLMPHPGFAVAERKEHEGDKLRLRDIRPGFLETVDVFVRNIFSPDRIVMKKVNNKPVSGIDFINLTLRYFEQLSSGKMPKVETIYEATAKAALLSECEDCIAMYERRMEEGIEKGASCKADFQNLHATSKEEIFGHFHQQPQLGGQKLIDEYTEYLNDKIQDAFATYQAKYDKVVGQQKYAISERCDEIRKKYVRLLNERCSADQVDDIKLQEIEQTCRSEALTQFERLKEMFLSKFFTANLEAFQREIYKDFTKFRDVEKHKHDAEEARLDFLIRGASMEYLKLMNDRCGNEYLTDEEFAEVHELASAEAFRTLFQSSPTQEKMETVGGKGLHNEIRKYERNLKKANASKKNRSNQLEKARMNYRTLMMDMLGSEPVSNAEIDEAHEKCKPKTNGRMPEDELNQIIDDEFLEIKKMNSRKKKMACSDFDYTSHKVYDTYCEKMDEAEKSFCEENELETLHIQAKNAALGELDKLQKTCLSRQFQSMKMKLEKRIDAYYMQACSTNKANKKRLDKHGKSILLKLVSDYKALMYENSKGVYINKNSLRKIHDDFLRYEVERQLVELDCNKELKKKLKESCVETLEGLFASVLQSNEKAKPVCARVQEEPKCEGMDGTAALAAGISGASGAVIGAKLGAYAGSLAGPVGAGAGAMLGAATGYAGARFYGWWKPKNKTNFT